MIRHRRPTGFTVIEMVIAIALAISMIVAVYSATRTMSDTAQRQKEYSLKNMRQQKFVEVVRRDLRGWVIQTQATVTAPPTSSGASSLAEESQALLRFNTTADGLSSAIQAGSANDMRGISNLQYVLRKNGDGLEIVRIEAGADGKGCELALFQSGNSLKMEFFDGIKWAGQWNGKQRPALIRITADGRVLVIGS
jgi:type II secretory pathway pseudopilin PulG